MTKIFVPVIIDEKAELFELSISERNDSRSKKAKLLLNNEPHPKYTDAFTSKFRSLSHNVNLFNSNGVGLKVFTSSIYSARLGIFLCLEQFINSRQYKNNWGKIVVTGNFNCNNNYLNEISIIEKKYEAVLKLTESTNEKILYMYVSDKEINLHKNESVSIKRFKTTDTLNEVISFLFNADIKYYKDYIDRWGTYEGIHELPINEIRHMNHHFTFQKKNGVLSEVRTENSFGALIGPKIIFNYDSENKLIGRSHYDEFGKIQFIEEFKKDYSIVNIFSKAENTTTMAQGFYIEDILENYKPSKKNNYSCSLLKRNESGYILEKTFYKFHDCGEKFHDISNSYGKHYVLDEKGRVIKEFELRKDGSIKDGFCEEYIYDDQDNRIIESSISMNHFKYKHQYTYDRYGNIVCITNLNNSNNEIFFEDCLFSRRIFTYDTLGLFIKTQFQNPKGEYVTDEEGIGIFINKYDEFGRLIAQKRTDLNETLFSLEGAPAEVLYKRNEIGKVIEETYYGVDGKQVRNSNGVYLTRINESENELTISNYDVQGNLMIDNMGVAVRLFSFDENGYLSSLSNYDMNKTLCYDTKGFCLIGFEKDEYGNILTETIFNETYFKLTMRYEYENTRLTKIEYLDRYDNLCLIEKYGYDENNNCNTLQVLTPEEELDDLAYGASTVCVEYDSDGLIQKYGFFNRDMEPVSLSEKKQDMLLDKMNGFLSKHT